MMKNNKGIALASLVITVVVMLSITGTIVYNSTDTIKLRKLDNMYNDIILLSQKTTSYFLDNNELPTFGDAIHKNVITNTIVKEKLNPNDGPYYYVVDLSELGGITLKFGRDYNKYKDDYTKKDVYIINESSHTIYYLKGIAIKGDGIDITKYSLEENYTAIGKGQIPIPDRFYYVGGDKSTGFVISDNIADENDGVSATLAGNQFVWIPVDNYEDFKRYNWTTENIITKPSENVSYSEADDSTENGTDESKEMYKSVRLYGGFYIARYEAGYDNISNIISKYVGNKYGDIEGGATTINWGEINDDDNPGTGAVTLARRNVYS